MKRSEEDGGQIRAFADRVLEARYKYGWVVIASLALTLLFGSTCTIGKVGWSFRRSSPT